MFMIRSMNKPQSASASSVPPGLDPDRAERARSIPIDQTRQKQSGADCISRLDAVAQCDLDIDQIAAIADGCHTRGEVSGPPLYLIVMSMHVPETWEDGLAACINKLSACWD